MTETDQTVQTQPEGPRRPRLSTFGWEVHRRVEALQRDLHDGGASAHGRATALLAQLRQSVTRPPGSVPAIWDLTIGWLWEPADDGTMRAVHSDAPTHEERAAHAALTLYAVHQQSRGQRMHVPGHGFGRAVRGLTARDSAGQENEKPARRRFNAVMTASTFDEAVYHLRGLVTQLRAANVPLDYGMLADDLRIFQFPGGGDAVRRRWGRQYYQVRPETIDTQSATTAATQPQGVRND